MVEKIIDNKTKKVWEYYLDPKLKHFLDTKVIERIKKQDKDYVMLIDGYEGVGKSTFAQQIGRYVDNSMDLSQICMTVDEFKQSIIDAGKGKCIIYDEAVTGMTAGDSISKVGRVLKSMMMQMRQKNLFVIVILPVLFEFNKYAVLSRARSFFHMYESKGRMGYWVGYNQKDTRLTYLKGKKTHSYTIRSRFRGRFYGKYAVDEKKYRKKKEDALFLINEEDDEVSRWRKERDACLKALYKELKSYRRVLEAVGEFGFKGSLGNLNSILNKKVEK